MAEQNKSRSESSSSASMSDSAIFASSLVQQVNKDDITSMIYIQREILSRFEKTNEMLINFNILSTGRYEATVKEFSKHTKLLFDMKRDLDNIFKRIRILKQRLATLYPEAYAACNSVYDVPSEEENSDDEDGDGAETHTPEAVQMPDSHLDVLSAIDNPFSDNLSSGATKST